MLTTTLPARLPFESLSGKNRSIEKYYSIFNIHKKDIIIVAALRDL